MNLNILIMNMCTLYSHFAHIFEVNRHIIFTQLESKGLLAIKSHTDSVANRVIVNQGKKRQSISNHANYSKQCLRAYFTFMSGTTLTTARNTTQIF